MPFRCTHALLHARDASNASLIMPPLCGLQTDEAKAAFEAGGGGRRAEAQRLLAAAKAMAAGKGSKDSKDSKISKAAGGSTAPSNSGAAVAPGAGDSGSGDWRLRAPDRGGNMPAFKPGAVTWDTEDYTTAEGQANKRKAEKLAEMAAGGPSKAPGKLVAGLSAGKMSPKERYEAEGHVKWVQFVLHVTACTVWAASKPYACTFAAWSPSQPQPLQWHFHFDSQVPSCVC